MRGKHTILLMAIFATTIGCTRRPLCDCETEGNKPGESAMIDVKIDWSRSGIDPKVENRSDGDYVHRVSLRFFPKDGSEAFDRYLESNIFEGEISVPIGDYSVVVFNESIYDPYWIGVVEFENVDNYEDFTARLTDDEPTQFDFFDFDEGMDLSVEAFKLASWSIDNFSVSENMTLSGAQLSDSEEAMKRALTNIELRRLTTTTTIYADVENLSSVYRLHAALEGLSESVNITTGEPYSSTTTHVWQLTRVEWDDESEQRHGTISEERLTFAAPNVETTHTLTLEVLLINGSRYEPENPLKYDVSDQIRGLTRYADNDLKARVSASLPYVTGQIVVGDWGDDNVVDLE